MKVQIFTSQLMNKPGYTNDLAEQREGAISSLQDNVNDFLEKHPDATVQWLQNSASCYWGSFTQLTAVVIH